MTTQEQITDNTSAITFATPVTLPATNEPSLVNGTAGGVSLMVNTNDTKGYGVYVANLNTCSNSAMATTGCTGQIPGSDLTVSGNATTGFVPISFSATGTQTDASTTASAGAGDSLTDNYQLTIPSGTPAGNYTTVLQYSVTGN
jgi:hypothetical protein